MPALDSVRQLMAERAKFEKWLTDLEAKRESTPPHVFDRVKADYGSRLQGVLDKLRQHAGAMREHAAALSQRLEQLGQSEQGILDSRAESELRAQVGELSRADWDKISKKLERDLAKIKQDQDLIASDLKSIRALLGDFEPAPSRATPLVTPAQAAQEPATEPAGAKVDELEFLKSVIGPTSPVPGAPAVGESETQAATSAPAEQASIVEPPPPGPVIKPRSGEEPLASHVTGTNPIVLRTSGVVEQPKTLKCAECGSMNYPSEWYCERCGAELTNI